MMNFTYKYNEFDEAKDLAPLLEEKLLALQKFIDEDATALFESEFDKVAEQRNGKIFRIEVNLTVDGNLYRAEATEESFEAAIDEVRDELDKELRRSKQKLTAILRNKNREAKKAIHNSLY